MPTKNYDNLISNNVPLVFADGTKIYEQLAQTYIRHKVGYFVLAPSGAGKTHYIESQTEPHWLDGDDLWMSTNAHPDGPWWTEGIETINEIDQRSDVITVQAKKYGFWVLGASNFWLKPDAIIIPDWETHKSWIKKRETTNYDGGVKSDQLEQLQSHRNWILNWEKHGVPKFETVEAAAEFLAKQSGDQTA